MIGIPKIERIYTGCRISHENLDLLKEKYPNIEIVELEDTDKEFKLIEKQYLQNIITLSKQ